MNHADTDFVISSLDEAGKLVGIASDPTMNRNGWAYAPGAFTKSLAAHKARGTAPAFLLFHDEARPAGTWDKIEPLASGLKVTGTLVRETKDGAEAYALLRAGALRGLSTGCIHLETVPAPPPSRGMLIKEADLFEISLVTVPANPNGRVLRVTSIGGAREIEDLLRHETDLSGRVAKAAAAAAWRAIQQCRDEPSDERLKSILSEASTSVARFIKE